MRTRLSLALARRLVADAPWAQDRLRPFAGHRVSWDLAGLRGALSIDEHGLPLAAPEPEAAGSDKAAGSDRAAGPDDTARSAAPASSDSPLPSGAARRRPGVHLHLDAADVGAISQGMESLMRKVSIEGNAGLAAELAYIARHLRPDIEDWLAPWLGDVLAEQTGRQLRAGAGWGGQAVQRAARAAAEYTVHEARLLVDGDVLAAHLRAVDHVREHADRLQQRMLRLERRLAATPRRTRG